MNEEYISEGFTKRTSFKIVLTALFSATYAILTPLPLNQLIGGSGILSINAIITPIFGIFLGPLWGLVAGLIGGIVSASIFPAAAGLWIYSIIAPGLGGFIGGTLVEDKIEIHSRKIPSRMIAVFIFIIGIVGYLIQLYSAWWFILPHIVAMILLLSLSKFENTNNEFFKKILLWVYALIATFGEHVGIMMGAVYYLNLNAYVMGYIIFPAVIFERTMITLISGFVILILKKVFDLFE